MGSVHAAAESGPVPVESLGSF
ncbi:hypothetical protein SBV1_460053 [Verrucomicrobia bacterium]|nr:hypothetical protein SBV1_460053 [Verrucomicrobiota bacterium]